MTKENLLWSLTELNKSGGMKLGEMTVFAAGHSGVSTCVGLEHTVIGAARQMGKTEMLMSILEDVPTLSQSEIRTVVSRLK